MLMINRTNKYYQLLRKLFRTAKNKKRNDLPTKRKLDEKLSAHNQRQNKIGQKYHVSFTSRKSLNSNINYAMDSQSRSLLAR